MLQKSKNITELLQGNWQTVAVVDNDGSEKNFDQFELKFKQDLIFCSIDQNHYWPKVCSYSAIGSADAAYYFREDGCFFQIKSIDEESLAIELNKKGNELVESVTFHLNKK